MTVNFTPDQAQALWSAGGFIVIADTPEGSEYGIDGVYHTTLSFSGTKFLPPGLHLISWSAPTSISTSASGSGSGSGSASTQRKPVIDTGGATSSSSDAGGAGPGALPLRQSILIYTQPKERLLLRWSHQSETLILDHSGGSSISDIQLKSLDASLAPYPFQILESWKALTAYITERLVKRFLGRDVRVDGMRRVEGEVDEVEVKRRKDALRDQGEGASFLAQDVTTGCSEGSGPEDGRRIEPASALDEEESLHFTTFDLKRSFRTGAIGEEVTRYSKDKSWLLLDVLRRVEDPLDLIGELQLAFILTLHLSSYSALQVYKRIISLFAQSISAHSHPSSILPSSDLSPTSTSHHGDVASLRKAYIALIQSLATQITALPLGVFDTELPEMDVRLSGEIERLRVNIRAGTVSGGTWVTLANEAGNGHMEKVQEAWDTLRASCRRFDWDIGQLDLQQAEENAGLEEDDESEEEGEYAPIIVE